MKESPDPSRFNLFEADRVLQHVRQITTTGHVSQQEIGVISQYAAQVARIESVLNDHDFSAVKVGSVGQYQGEEKQVIIISTVRTPDKLSADQLPLDKWENAMGFLRNPKRFNIALTCAKKLLVVVGDPRVLVLEDDWHAIKLFCRNQQVLAGEQALWRVAWDVCMTIEQHRSHRR